MSLLCEDTPKNFHHNHYLMIYKENFEDNIYDHYFDCAFKNTKFLNEH